MIFGLIGRTARNRAVVERLYGTIVEAARRPVLYAGFAIPDTFEGRFESLTLHAVLVLAHLRSAPDPGPELGQALVDTIFRHFDRTLREMGVGDTAVPKRMKKLAEAFLGRSAAYGAALAEGEASLGTALSRNVYAGRRDAADLARYAMAVAADLRGCPLADYTAGTLAYPDPASPAEAGSSQQSA